LIFVLKQIAVQELRKVNLFVLLLCLENQVI